MATLIGNKPNQIPTNADLGQIAFRDDNPQGGIVGTTEAQTLTNKTISAADNTLVGVASTGKAIAMAIVFGG